MKSAPRARAFCAWAALCLLFGSLSPATAQVPPTAGFLAPGFPIVSGFSGSRLSATPLPPGVNPLDKTSIDLDGPALRVLDASSMGAPPRAQVLPVPKPFTVPAGRIGQVFALALDDAIPPNIYAAATSAYGLPIVVPDADGDGLPDRSRKGAPQAAFMPGLFGPADAGGGPGSIWRIDGVTGTVALFTNVALDGAPNSGPALGGMTFDPASRLLIVADRDTGMIHSFTLDGRETDRFDHGTQGLSAIGLPPIPFDPDKRLDIQSPEFDSADPATWNYAPPSRRVFGLGVWRGRLYYAVAAGMRIWSVSLGADGRFGPDPRVEIAVTAGSLPDTEISEILFDDGGDMLLAERGAPTGAYDFGALTQAGTGRVLRLRGKPPGANGTPFFWEPAGEYAIGFPPNFQNGDGGIALGHGYDPAGFADIGSCGGTLWTTGSQLRITPDPALAQILATGGPLPIDGLQANAVSLLRPLNTPPLASYFIDFDDVTAQAGTPGHMGDVITWRGCAGPLYPLIADLLVVEEFCPVGFLRRGNACLPAPCEIGEFYRAGFCHKPECPPGQTAREGICCPRGTPWNPRTRTCGKPEPHPDLTVVKEVIRCGGAGQCLFRIIVTNVGNAPYSGPVAVGDLVNPGTVNGITGPAGWQCSALQNNVFACINQNAAIAPGESVGFVADVDVQAGGRGWQNCAAVSGDPAKETNWGNNKSCVKGDPKPDDKPDLRVEKRIQSCNPNGCAFIIVITNVGSGTYTGDIVLTEGVIGGTISDIFPTEPQGWSAPCEHTQPPGGVTDTWVCRRPNTTVPPGGSLTVGIGVKLQPGAKLVKNCALVINPAGDANNANNGACAEHKPDPGRPNLTIQKSAPASCARSPGSPPTYTCEWTITVSNTGTADSTGEVVVSDGAMNGRVVSAGGNGWNCTVRTEQTLTCRKPGGIARGDTQTIRVVAEYKNVLRAENCAAFGENIRMGAFSRPRFASSEVSPEMLMRLAQTVRGGGEIPAGSGTVSTESSCASIELPRDPRLIVVKERTGECSRLIVRDGGPAAYSCQFKITVTNVGQAPYTGDIRVTDSFTGGTLFSVSGDGGDCTSDGASKVCQWFDKTLARGASISLTVTVQVRGNTPFENCATLNIPPGADRSCVSGFATDPVETRPRDPICGPGLIPVRQPTGLPRCCTPETVAAGACGGTTTGCPPGMVTQPGGGCCPAGQTMIDGVCSPPIVTTCPFPLLQQGGNCCTREAIMAGTCGTTARCPPGTTAQPGGGCCPAGQTMIDGACSPPVVTTCAFPLIQAGGTCCTREALTAGTCGKRPSTDCPDGRQRVNGVCPSGTTQCKEGQFRGDNGKCQDRPKTTPQCGAGTKWNGETCAKTNDGSKSKSCEKGFSWNGRSCVKDKPRGDLRPQCPGGTQWNGRSCVPIQKKFEPKLPITKPPEKKITPPFRPGGNSGPPMKFPTGKKG